MSEFIFWTASVILLYTYIGYPLLIWVLARLFQRTVRYGDYQPSVAVIVVVYNELERIGEKLEACLALDYPKKLLRIVIVSDGSDDGTNELLTAYASRGIKVIVFPGRRGKAACLNDAVESCDATIIVFTDARQRLAADAIRYLVENFSDPNVGAASGELVFETDGMTGFGEGVDAYWRYEKFIRQQESRVHSVIGVTGALYALRRECFSEISADTILDDVVIPMNVVMAGRRVVFESRARAFDLPARDHREEKRRKVRTIAGNYQLMAAHPEFFVPLRNPIFFQLVSHKVLRLVGPLCMVLLFFANVSLFHRGFLYQCLFAAQLIAYSLPAIGGGWPFARRWKLVKLATAFLLLNWFAVLGAVEFLRNRNIHLWMSKQPTSSGKR